VAYILSLDVTSSIYHAIPELVSVLIDRHGPLPSVPDSITSADMAIMFLLVSCSDASKIMTFLKASLYYNARDLWTKITRVVSTYIQNGGVSWEGIPHGLTESCHELFSEAITTSLKPFEILDEKCEQFFVRHSFKEGGWYTNTKNTIAILLEDLESGHYDRDRVALLVINNRINDLCCDLIRARIGLVAVVSRDAIFDLRQKIMAELATLLDV
jgi:hypothetical protein